MVVSKAVRWFEKLQIKIVYVVQLVKLNSYVRKRDRTLSLLR